MAKILVGHNQSKNPFEAKNRPISIIGPIPKTNKTTFAFFGLISLSIDFWFDSFLKIDTIGLPVFIVAPIVTCIFLILPENQYLLSLLIYLPIY